MIEITPEHMAQIAPLFAGQRDSLIRSCLDGTMGRAWADREDGPVCARIILGDFCFFGGDARWGEELVRDLPPSHRGETLIQIPHHEAWDALLERVHGAGRRISRYALDVPAQGFCRDRLLALENTLPAGYALAPLAGELVERALGEAWSRDFCSTFRDADDYRARGLGCVALWNGKLVCGASSYAVYDGGLEIEIDTRPAHRRRGLAAACAAALIRACLDRGLVPHWDAANRESEALACKLGYVPMGEYAAFRVKHVRGGD